jgi:hypothetical protein
MLRQIRTVGSAVERFVDIEEVTGSIPVRSTSNNRYKSLLLVSCGGYFLSSARSMHHIGKGAEQTKSN